MRYIRSRAHHRIHQTTNREGDSFNKPGRSAINKLLTNGLAHQLLETTTRKKTIRIKCDPSESDSVWKWLKRWTAITSSVDQQPVKSFGIGHQVLEGKTNVTEGIPKNTISNAALSVLSELVLPPTKLMMADDDEHYLMIGDTDGFQCQTSVTSQYNSFNFGEAEKLQPGNDILDTTAQDYAAPKVVNDERLDCIDDTKQVQPNKNSGLTGEKSPVRKDCFNHDTEKASSEMLENGGKKIAVSSRKPCNPAFVAAQSKLEELSSKSAVGRSVSSAYQNASSKSKSENQNIHTSPFTDNNEAVSAKTSVMYDSRLQTATSECGTEISITSTLDSPDRSDMEGGEIVLEIRTLENKNYDVVEENAFELPSLSGNCRPEDGDDDVADSNVSINLTQSGHKSAEPTSSSAMTHQQVTTEQGRSLEGTPVNYESAADAHGTPSSDISVNARKKKKDDNMSTYRQRLQLVGKNLSSSPNNGSGVQISAENLVKDPKIPKRRNSFGMAKTDHVEQEPRLSSSNSLPGYMQATASARAKAFVSTSQKSSPDQQDNQPKKRHSLPVENGKQSSSPRMQRSASQAQPNVKVNSDRSPHTSAERRWQR
ncbi:protein IQ-DOMAIN 32-like [Curcuma longa]|uniref:protein IQ-DOMAIN 32-like n=1 Tax=Curcuma longa TaxID=136217 RepID=UPI003D9F57C4